MDRLEDIFQRIHDNVYSHSLLSDQMKLPPVPPDLPERIAALRGAQAPYYVVSGNPLARTVKKLHNLVLKLFGRKQAYHNHLMLDLLESMTAYLQAVQVHNTRQTSRIESLVQQLAFQTEQLAALEEEYQKLLSTVEQIAPKPKEGAAAEQQERPASE